MFLPGWTPNSFQARLMKEKSLFHARFSLFSPSFLTGVTIPAGIRPELLLIQSNLSDSTAHSGNQASVMVYFQRLGVRIFPGGCIGSRQPDRILTSVTPLSGQAPNFYLRTCNVTVVIIMAETMEEKRRKIARKALEEAENTGDRQTVNAQRKANKELTGFEGDE
jgi:hypothetical protein